MQNLLKKNYINYLKTGKNIVFRTDIHLIGGCNFKCIMCDNWKREVKMLFNYNQLQKFIIVLKTNYNCNYIRFHGQEPTMYDKLEDLILFSKKLGFKIGIKTNAWLLSNERLIKIIKYGLDDLYLSIDGPNEIIHDNIRGVKGSFQKNIDVIKKSKKIKPDLKIFINSVVMKDNYKYLSEMIELGLKYKLDRVSFVFLNDKNRKDIKGINLSKKEFFLFFQNEVLDIFKKSNIYKIPVDFSPFIANFSGKNNDFIIYELINNLNLYKKEIESFYKGNYGKYFYDKYGCFGPLDHASINYNGDMYGCCVVERDRTNSIGNIIEEELVDLWNKEKYLNYRKNSNELCSYSNKCASNFYNRKKLFKDIYLDDNLYQKNIPINYYRYLKELQNEDKNLIDSIKLGKLKNLLLKFYDNLEFYKRLLNELNINRIDIEKISSLDFIKKLPILDKKILKENIEEIKKLSIGKQVLNGKTSGNSGDKLEFFYPLDFKRYIKQISIFSEQGDFIYDDAYFSITPINCNQTIINDLKEPEYVKKIYITIMNFEYKLENFLGIKKIFDDNKKFDFLYGDSKYILFIILGFKKFHLDLPKIKSISVSYSYTNKSLKEYIAKIFNCEIYDNYGCSEVGPISMDKNGKKEIFGDNIIVEEINSEIIVSDLDNDIFPFIRYKNGDLGKISGNIVDLYGKKNQVINGMTLRDLDDFFYKNFPEIIVYQLIGNELYIIGNNYNIEKLKLNINLFFGNNIEIIFLENNFLKIGECSKFKVIN